MEKERRESERIEQERERVVRQNERMNKNLERAQAPIKRKVNLYFSKRVIFPKLLTKMYLTLIQLDLQRGLNLVFRSRPPRTTVHLTQKDLDKKAEADEWDYYFGED